MTTNTLTNLEKIKGIIRWVINSSMENQGALDRWQQEELQEMIQSLLSQQRDELTEKGKSEAYKNVGSWYKVPIREGMVMTKNIDGTGGTVNVGCEVCGGVLVYIRGKHPGEDSRKVCPTCAVEIIESLLSNCNERDAGSNLLEQMEGEK